jgi:hypothetical protein
MEHAVLGLPYVHYAVVRSAAERNQHECRIWNDYRPTVNKIAPPGCKPRKKRLSVELPEIGDSLIERWRRQLRD